MILCSPSFIYLSEITEEKDSQLGPYDLASRLSYALWAAPPDDKLLTSAASGKITQTDELAGQIRRMLRDDRAGEFVNGFLDSWLNLRDIGNLIHRVDGANKLRFESEQVVTLKGISGEHRLTAVGWR